MRLRIFSDLHLEFDDWTPPAVEADAVVLAGDIDVGADGLTWARQHFGSLPVVYVPGNHEFYGKRWQRALANLRDTARSLNIALLDGDEAVIDGIRFLGATLWSDFELEGSEPHSVERAMETARTTVNDYRVIGYGNEGLLRPRHVRQIHRERVAWLERKLAEPYGGSTVVVTHHLPHRRSIQAKYRSNVLNPSFASDLSRLVRPPVTLWIHGHTHESLDYVENGTRVICNPGGYRPHEPNPTFDPGLVVRVS